VFASVCVVGMAAWFLGHFCLMALCALGGPTAGRLIMVSFAGLCAHGGLFVWLWRRRRFFGVRDQEERRSWPPRPRPSGAARIYLAAFVVMLVPYLCAAPGERPVGAAFDVLRIVGFGLAVVGAKRYAASVGFDTGSALGLFATLMCGLGNLVLFYLIAGLVIAAVFWPGPLGVYRLLSAPRV